MKKINCSPACLAMACFVLTGCAGTSELSQSTEADRYRCENDIAFTVRFTSHFAGDSAVIDSNRGYEVLYRAAAGANKAAYSNPRMRAEFGLGAAHNQALLRYLLQPVVVCCTRD